MAFLRMTGFHVLHCFFTASTYYYYYYYYYYYFFYAPLLFCSSARAFPAPACRPRPARPGADNNNNNNTNNNHNDDIIIITIIIIIFDMIIIIISSSSSSSSSSTSSLRPRAQGKPASKHGEGGQRLRSPWRCDRRRVFRYDVCTRLRGFYRAVLCYVAQSSWVLHCTCCCMHRTVRLCTALDRTGLDAMSLSRIVRCRAAMYCTDACSAA